MVWQDWQCSAAWASSNSFRAELKITKWNSAWKKTQANPCVGKEIQNKEMETRGNLEFKCAKKAEEWMAHRWCPLNQVRGFSCSDWNYSNWNMTGTLWLVLLHFANKLMIAQLLMMRTNWSLSFYAFAKIFYTLLTFSMADMKHHILWFRKFVNSVRVADCSFPSAPRESLIQFHSVAFGNTGTECCMFVCLSWTNKYSSGPSVWSDKVTEPSLSGQSVWRNLCLSWLICFLNF